MGKWICQHKMLPAIDPFSYTCAMFPDLHGLVVYQWLTEVIFLCNSENRWSSWVDSFCLCHARLFSNNYAPGAYLNVLILAHCAPGLLRLLLPLALSSECY